MATTCMLQIATAIIENEQKARNVEAGKQADKMFAAQDNAMANPSDFGAQIMRALEEDRMAHLSQLHDAEMQSLVATTRAYLSQV